MNKEQIIDEVYENFEKWYNEHSGKEDYTGYYVPTKEEFINKCKTDPEFSERWGLKIEERELSLEERRIHAPVKNIKHSDGSHAYDSYDWVNIPTKLITITYKDTIIESYE